MDSTRQLKMARLLQKEMGDIFETDMRRLFPGAMITLTRVNVTKDMSIARFYVSIFALKDKKPTIEEIREHIPGFRFKLGNQIRRQVRIVPHLEFFLDDSLDYIENLEKIMK
jgi:ribosome-binding factor A